MSLRSIERPAPGRMKGVGGNGNDMIEQFRFLDRPFKQLLPAHGTANAEFYFFDTQEIFQGLIGPDHIPGGKKRKTVIVGQTCNGIIGKRTQAAVTTARHIYAYYKKSFRINQMSVTHKTGPPVNRIAVCRKCMKDPYDIRLIRIEFAEYMIPEMITG